jgi:hypothetical protein
MRITRPGRDGACSRGGIRRRPIWRSAALRSPRARRMIRFSPNARWPHFAWRYVGPRPAETLARGGTTGGGVILAARHRRRTDVGLVEGVEEILRTVRAFGSSSDRAPRRTECSCEPLPGGRMGTITHPARWSTRTTGIWSLRFATASFRSRPGARSRGPMRPRRAVTGGSNPLENPAGFAHGFGRVEVERRRRAYFDFHHGLGVSPMR